jgi:hypothetical protein
MTIGGFVWPKEDTPKAETLEGLAELNKHDEVARALEVLIANGELADYDDELANRVHDAIRMVRGVSSLVSKRRLVNALVSGQ